MSLGRIAKLNTGATIPLFGYVISLLQLLDR